MTTGDNNIEAKALRLGAACDDRDEALAAGWIPKDERAVLSITTGKPIQGEPIAPAHEHFTTVDLADLANASYEPPDYVVSKLIPRRFVTLLGGHGGMGKSMLACVLACHVVSGREWCGFGVAKLPVTIISLEDDGDLVRLRLKWVAQAYGLPFDAVEQGITVLDGTSGEGVFAAEVNIFGTRSLVPTASWLEAVEKTEGAGLIVIDNASDAFGGNENARGQVRTFIRQLASLAVLRNAGVLLLAHIDKQAAKFGGMGNTYSGSTAWHNGPRSRLALTESAGVPTLVHEKLNLGKQHETPISLGFNDHGVIVPARFLGGDSTARSDESIVLDALSRALRSGSTVPTATYGPATTFAALDPFLGDELRDKRRINTAIVRLMEADRIHRESYTDKHRNHRERWGLTQTGASDTPEILRQ